MDVSVQMTKPGLLERIKNAIRVLVTSPCPYCHSSKEGHLADMDLEIINNESGSGYLTVYPDSGEIWYTIVGRHNDFFIEDSFKIKHCPMCGRKLD